tara:strand:+ start:59 stop:445 length:387 start_codon:yes stop_codon:yes gene_type:complete
MKKEEIQNIINTVYPNIQKYYGKGKLSIPPIELHKDIYARVSGIDGMEGEDSKTSEAQYEEYANVIYIYYPNMVNEEHVIRSIIHEYTHYKQDHALFSKFKQMYGYDEDPTEIAARKAEEDWYMFSLK